jgi:uncharacterized membrane protein YesL
MPSDPRPDWRERLIDVSVITTPLIVTNFTWFLLSLPIITLIPATGGLYYATNQLANEGDAGWRTVWEGFRIHFWQSWRWGLMNLIVYGGFLINKNFYAQVNANWAAVVQLVFIFLTILWTVLQLYIYPLLLELEEPKLWNAVRNSFALFILRPLQTFGWFLALGVIVLASRYLIWPAWVVITVSWLLYLSNRATLTAIKTIKK